MSDENVIKFKGKAPIDPLELAHMQVAAERIVVFFDCLLEFDDIPEITAMLDAIEECFEPLHQRIATESAKLKEPV